MAIVFKKKSYGGRFPEIWRGECKVLPGGFKPVQNFPVGTLLRRGTPLFVDFASRTAAVLKVSTVEGGGTAESVRIAKGHSFVPGDSLTELDKGGVIATVKNVDSTNVDYDVLELDKSLTGVAEGSIVVECGEEAGKSKYAAPNMILSADKEFTGKGLDTLDAGYEALVLYSGVCYPVLPEWLQGAGSPCLKLNPNIMFITQ